MHSLHCRIPAMITVTCLMMSPLAMGHDREAQALGAHRKVADSPSWLVQTNWDTRYFIEGRDALDGDSLWYNNIEWSDGPLALGLWYGNSPDRSYDEVQVSAAVSHSVGDFDGYVGLTHLRFPFEGAFDNEVGAGVVYSGCPIGVELALDAYHSFEADGYFAEAAATRGWDLADSWSCELSAIFGMNQGYVADGHDGANHVALSVGLAYALSENLQLIAHGTQSWAVDRKPAAPGDGLLKDFFHAGIGLEWQF